MISRAFVLPTVVSTGLSLAFAFAVTTETTNRAIDAREAMSCFVIAGKVACIEAGYVPVMPAAPGVTVPIGPDFTGENEDIVIRDDGGRQVASG